MPQHDDEFDRAVDNVAWCRTVHIGERRVDIACLIRTGDWRPLKAPWWRGKEVSVIGADIDGNFFLRHCDGSIRYWDHRLQTDVMWPSACESSPSLSPMKSTDQPRQPMPGLFLAACWKSVARHGCTFR